MVTGFLCGRAILSLSMFLFFLNAVWNVHPKAYLKQKWWLLGLGWVGLYALSYFWSTDIIYWEERVQSKFAFFIIPLAFGVLKPFSKQQLRWFSFGLIALLCAGCIYSLSFYFSDPGKVLSGYFYSKVFPTPAYKDHIRYSIFIAWAIIWCCYQFPKLTFVTEKIIFSTAIFFFSVYLHILSARSGLFVLYSFVLLYIGYLFLTRKIITASIISLSGIALIFAAYFTIPSFRAKIYYGIYSINEYKSGNKSADFSDIGRIISYELAAKIICEHPVLGVGAGDIRAEMKKKYEQFSPGTKPEQRIVPHNQMMEVTLAGGIVTLLLFLYWLFFPLRKIKRDREGFYVFATWFVLFISMMVEAMLEIQFGVFVYLFCLLWMIKATEINTSPEAQS